MVNIIEQHLPQIFDILVLFVVLVVKRWSWVVGSEFELFEIDSFAFAAVSCLVPLDEITGQLARFSYHLC